MIAGYRGEDGRRHLWMAAVAGGEELVFLRLLKQSSRPQRLLRPLRNSPRRKTSSSPPRDTCHPSAIRPWNLPYAAERVTSCGIEQKPGSGDQRLRTHRLALAVYGAGKAGAPSLEKVIPVTVEGVSTPVPELVGALSPLFLWPNHGAQAYVRLCLDPQSLAYARAHLEQLTDTQTRYGVWMMLQDMVREGLLSPTDFLTTFIAKASMEPDCVMVKTLFSLFVRDTLDRFVGASRHRLEAEVHAMAARNLGQARANRGSCSATTASASPGSCP